MARVKVHTPCMLPLSECGCPPDPDDDTDEPEDDDEDCAA